MNKYIAVQLGARRNYAVPSILAKSGLLLSLYTDFCANAGVGAMVDTWCPKFLKRGAIARLLSRRVSSELSGKVHTFESVSLRYLVGQKLARNHNLKQHWALTKYNHEFGQAMIDKGFGHATHIFSMFGEGIEFVEYAKRASLKIITEIYLSPRTHQIVQEERKRFPTFELCLPEQVIQADFIQFGRVCSVTDVFIAPSQFVVDGLVSFGVDKQQCKIVPYGVSDSWFELKNTPEQGRILFVGTADIRKGIHILGMAAEKLHSQNYNFRVAGNVSDLVRKHQQTQLLNFLGRIPRGDIQKEYAIADIFVLPSLAEGSAEVIYEALASGLPVITTEAAGSVVRDGIEGFIVPTKDAEALADRIDKLVRDRELRQRMATAAKERAKEYTWSRYAERLLHVLSGV